MPHRRAIFCEPLRALSRLDLCVFPLLAASGNVKRQPLTETLQRALGGWKSLPVAAPSHAPIRTDGGARSGFMIVNYPGATQSHPLLAAKLPREAAADPLLAELLTMVLRTRLMNNLRTAKGWSYEVYPFGVQVNRSGASVRFNIPLQTDKTGEAIAEIREEFRRLREEPISNETLVGAKSYLESTKITGALTSLELMNERLVALARNKLPTDYYAQSLQRLSAFTSHDIQTAARAMLDPDRFVWVVAGDGAAVERELGELGLRNVRHVSAGEVP